MANHEHHAHMHGQDPSAGGAEAFLRRGRWVFWLFAAIAAVYLVAEHRAHVMGALPFLIVLACPLLHMFMHGGHGGHSGHAGHAGHPGHDDGARKETPSENSRDGKE